MPFVSFLIKPEVSPSPYDYCLEECLVCACEVWGGLLTIIMPPPATSTSSTSSSRQQSVNYSPGFYPTQTQELPRHPPRATLQHQTWRLRGYWWTRLTVTAPAMQRTTQETSYLSMVAEVPGRQFHGCNISPVIYTYSVLDTGPRVGSVEERQWRRNLVTLGAEQSSRWEEDWCWPATSNSPSFYCSR